MNRLRNPLIFFGFLLFGVNVNGADLLGVYELALANDPTLREAEANRMAAQEAKPQAFAALLPQLNLSGSLVDQEDEGSAVTTTIIDAQGNLGLIPSDRAADAEQKIWTASLTQTVFRWDQWLALRRADKSIAQAEANYLAAQQDLVLRVAQAYFAALSAEDSLAAEQANKKAIARQLEQAETRFDVGLIAITDVYEARAAYDQTVAAEIGAKRALASAYENLRELTGVRVADLESPTDALQLKSPDPADEDMWVEQSLARNLSLESSRLAAEIARDDVETNRSGHYPTVDLNLSRNRFDSDGVQFNNGAGGVADTVNVRDSISLQVSVPVYSGGAVSSRVRQSVHLHRASKERLERVARQTERETRDAYLGVLAEISRVKALEQAVKSSETALQATEAGFEVGTRTTVDVLDSRRELTQAQTNYFQSRYDYIVNVLRLKAAAGSLATDDLQQVNSGLEKRAIIE